MTADLQIAERSNGGSVERLERVELETPFVGRAELLEQLSADFEDAARVVTVTGPPGIGKTRVAREFANTWTESFPGGVWFLELAEMESPSEIASTIAERLGIPIDAGDEIERTAHSLAGRGRTLVILDNAEHLDRAELAALLHKWLERASALRFLITSRSRLGAEFEICRSLSALTVDDAIALFEARARRITREFAVDEDNREAVRELVERLDRLPLAVKLAAGRIRLLSPDQMLERLNEPFDLLDSGDTGTRQRSLQEAIETSWQSLSDAEREALAQCAVFRGGFPIEAAEGVVELQDDAPPVLDVVAALVDNSLLQSTRDGSQGGRVELRMFESIRNFAADRLRDLHQVDEVQRRHAEYYRQQTRIWTGHRFDPEFLDWISTIEPHTENLEAVFEWYLGRNAEAAAEVCCTLADFYQFRQNLGRVDEFVERLLGEHDLSERPIVHAKLLHLKAFIVDSREKNRRAQKIRRRAIDLSEEGRSPRLRCNLLLALGFGEFVLGYYDRTEPVFREAIEIAEREGFKFEQTAILSIWGREKCEEGELGVARELFERALDLHEEIDAVYQASRLHINYSALLHRRGRYKEALEHVRRSVELVEGDGKVFRRTTGRANLAGLLTLVEDYQEADEQFEEAVELLQKRGIRKAQANTLFDHGLLLLEMGETDRAETKLDEARRLSGPENRAGAFSNLGGAHGALALVEARRDDEAAARQHMEAAEALVGRAPSQHTAKKFQRFLAIESVSVALALAGHRRDADETDEMQAYLERAGEQFRALDEDELESFEEKIAYRTLASAVDEWDGLAEGDTETEAIVLGPEARWLELGDGERLDFSRRGPMRRLVLALVESHGDSGASLSTYELLEEGWPEQNLSPDSGVNRVYTAISRLRDLGFDEYLETDDEGYFLAPDLDIRRVGNQ